jgi:succinoglycan biosynthesis transport protein ExoP
MHEERRVGVLMDDHEIDLRYFVALLKRQARIIALSLCMCLLAGLFVGLSSPPEYSATALIRVDPVQNELLLIEAPRTNTIAMDNARIASEVEIMRSAPTFVRVIESGKLDLGTVFTERPGIADQVLAFIGWGQPEGAGEDKRQSDHLLRLQEAVDIQRRGETYIIAVTAKAETPEGAALLANTIVEAYIELQKETKTATLVAAVETLSPQVASASAALVARREAISAFLDENLSLFAALPGNEALSDQVSVHGQSVNAARDLRARITRASLELEQWDLAGLAQTLGSEVTDALVRERNELPSRAALVPFAGAQSFALEQELSNLKSHSEDAVRYEISLLRVQLLALEAQIAALRDQMLKNLDEEALPQDVQTRLQQMQRYSDLSHRQYDQLLARLEELRLQVDLQQADSRVVAAATLPLHSSSRGLPFIMSLAALLGTGLGVGAAMFRENYVGGVVSQEQLAFLTGKEVETSIPAIGRSRSRNELATSSLADAVINTPLSSFAESMRRLRLGVDLRLPARNPGRDGGRGRVILVSSAVAGEGKTITALGLARTYGLSGQRVLLIDGDLRRPSLFIHLNAAPVAGLVDYLTGKLAPERFPSAIKTDPLSSVSAVVNTQPSSGPTEHLIVTEGFRSLVSAARDTFDVIIIDTPPLTEVVDGAYLMQCADAAILLTRYASTRQRDVLRALSVLENARPDMPPVLLAMTQHPERSVVINDRYVSHYVIVQ